jgi:hypothetical protein
MLQRAYERLMAHALLDPSFGAALLVDPRRAALHEGYSTLLAESLVGLRATTLNEFAASLRRRVYGRSAEPPAADMQPRHVSAAIVPFRKSVRG